MWSWIVFVSPSKSKLMPRRTRPYIELLFPFVLVCDFEPDGGW